MPVEVLDTAVDLDEREEMETYSGCDLEVDEIC